MEPRAAVQEFHEELRLRPEFSHVRGAEEILRVAREQGREIVKRQIVPDAHQGYPGGS